MNENLNVIRPIPELFATLAATNGVVIIGAMTYMRSR
jgi:hypothetical protein